MRLAQSADTQNLVSLYTEAALYAEAVGHIDWDKPFPTEVVEDFIQRSELFCMDGEIGLPTASVRLTTNGDEKIWQADKDTYLYVSKLATSNTVHGTNYTRTTLLPRIREQALRFNSCGIRLDCLADNPQLIRFYSQLGFTSLGICSFYSDKRQTTVAVTKFELAL